MNRLKEAGRFLIYLILVSFFVVTNLALYLRIESEALGTALTVGNVVCLTAAVWFIDLRRRDKMITKPVKKIREGIERAANGDLTVRIDKTGVSNAYEYGRIIDGINRMIGELGSVETLRTDFISNVSHEMKTPIAILQNYATLLQAAELDDDTRVEYAKKISAETRRLSALITNILKLNKLENQQIFPEKEPFDLTEQVCACMIAFEDRWEEKRLEIVTELDEDVTIEADREMLSIVWSNLISNAVKFTPEGGTITLSVKRDGNCAVVRVRDSGCGMDGDTLKNIFRKFYQGDTSHATEGNGLGLSLAKRIVDIHGGEIDVESEEGRGSAFTVSLPVQRPGALPK